MPDNVNPFVAQLLDWHGHAAGGVHIPFRNRQNPLSRVIETSLVRRLRELAENIAIDAGHTPRWIFLVGGPGNGKSETVQDFLSTLDDKLGLQGALRRVLEARFASTPLPRKVEIGVGDVAHPKFAAHVRRLIVVQDATASIDALGNAAKELADEIADLLTTPESTSPRPVFVACVNRGLLARAMKEAFREFEPINEVTTVLRTVIQASSLGLDTLISRKSCWPLEGDPRLACWPLDVESLLVGSSPSPFDQMLALATSDAHWETPGRCADCNSRSLCPLRQNAEWLRDPVLRANLIKLLRHGELARGQRWNFRDSFSLVAELLVGQWSDYGHTASPCSWIHEAVASAGIDAPGTAFVASLNARLYPQALFAGGAVVRTAQAARDKAGGAVSAQPWTNELLRQLAAFGEAASAKPVREALSREPFTLMDPAATTPADPAAPLRAVEEGFCQSVEEGSIAASRTIQLASSERLLLEAFAKAEQEWDLLGRESTLARIMVGVLRKLAAMIVKRSVGVRLCQHGLDERLAKYEASLRDRRRLQDIRNELQPLLGGGSFSFNVVEVLGQPTAERPPLIGLHGQAPGLRMHPAPDGTPSAPAHDVPCIEITAPSHRIPLTFDFFLALELRREGCAGSSLPASVRAALDRVRHKHAGNLARNEERFLDGRAFVTIGDVQRIEVPLAGASPRLVASAGAPNASR